MRALVCILTAAAIVASCTFHGAAPATSTLLDRAATIDRIAGKGGAS